MGDPVKYYEDYLLKKEGKRKWPEYWVIIRGCWMLFYSSRNVNDRNNFCGSLELSRNTRYSTGKRRNYSFPFYVSTPRGSHLFKCSSNLKRHQWMYVLGLAIKGFPPVPPPSFVPRVTVKDDDGDHIASWGMKEAGNINDGSDVQDDAPDDDDDDDGDSSLPPGVIFVTTLPDDLESNNIEREKLLNMMNKKEEYVPSNAVLCTGITGTTSMVNKRSQDNTLSPQYQLDVMKPLPKLVSRSTGSIKEDATLSSHLPLSSTLLLDNRPSTSPFPSVFDRSPLAFNAKKSSNLKFSRHMTNSAPDVQTLGRMSKMSYDITL